MYDPPPTAQTLVKDLRLKEKGRERGANNEPPATQPGEDPVERSVIDECNRLFFERKESYDRDCEALTERIRRARSETPSAKASDPLHAEMRDRVATEGPHLEELRREAQQAIDNLKSFRKDHDRREHPDVPGNLSWSVGILVGVVLVETVLNGVFFGTNLTGGFLEGGSYAVLISVLNVGAVGATGAWMLRLARHRDQPVRLGGTLGVLLVAAFAVMLNLGVAHYREALPANYPPPPEVLDSAAQPSPESQAIPADGAVTECWRGNDQRHGDEEAICLFLNRGLRLNGIQSYWLWVLGLMLCAWAIWKWSGMTDAYPGYGRLGRKQKNTETALRKEESELRRELKRDYHRALAKARDFEDPLESWKRADAAITELRGRHASFLDFAASLGASGTNAIEIYRSANRETGRTEPEPKSWSVPWRPEWRVSDPPAIPDIGVIDEAKRRSTEVRAIVDQRGEDLHGRYRDVESEVTRIARLVRE